jgi:hypothetical protein
MSDELQTDAPGVTPPEAPAPKVDMYYGDKKIVSVEPGFSELYTRVHTESGPIDLPHWEYKICVTTYPSDLSDLRNFRCVYIVDKLYDVLRELNIRVTQNECTYLTQKLLTKIQEVQKIAMLTGLGVASEDDIRLKLLESKLQ